MSYPIYLFPNDTRTDFLKYGYCGKYNYVLPVPPGTVVITTGDRLLPRAFTIINNDCEVELVDGRVFPGSDFNSTDLFTINEFPVGRITTNSSGLAYLLYENNIFDIVASAEEGGETGGPGGAGTIKIITESGIYIITETGFKLIKE